MLARMVVHMARPEPAHAVAEAVNPVVFEIVEHETQGKRPPTPPDVEQAKLPDPQEQGEESAAERKPCNRTAQSEGKAGKRISRLLTFRSLAPGPDHLDQDQRDKAGNGKLGG